MRVVIAYLLLAVFFAARAALRRPRHRNAYPRPDFYDILSAACIGLLWFLLIPIELWEHLRSAPDPEASRQSALRKANRLPNGRGA